MTTYTSMSDDEAKDALRQSLERAARQSGCDIDGLEIETGSLPDTWHTHCVIIFSGCDDKILSRAATFFAKWATKHLDFDAMPGRCSLSGEPIPVVKGNFHWYDPVGLHGYDPAMPKGLAARIYSYSIGD